MDVCRAADLPAAGSLTENRESQSHSDLQSQKNEATEDVESDFITHHILINMFPVFIVFMILLC